MASSEDSNWPVLEVKYSGQVSFRDFMARLNPLMVLLAKRRIDALRMVAFSRDKIPTPATNSV